MLMEERVKGERTNVKTNHDSCQSQLASNLDWLSGNFIEGYKLDILRALDGCNYSHLRSWIFHVGITALYFQIRRGSHDARKYDLTALKKKSLNANGISWIETSIEKYLKMLQG